MTAEIVKIYRAFGAVNEVKVTWTSSRQLNSSSRESPVPERSP